MFKIEIHQSFNQITSVFYGFGMWRNDHKACLGVRMYLLAYWALYAMFPVSLAFGAFASADMNATIFLVDEAIATLVVTVKFAYILWKQNEIHSLLQKTSAHLLKDQKQFLEIEQRLKSFIRFLHFYHWSIVLGCGFLLCLPLFSDEKKLPFNINFQLEWNYNEIPYVIAYSYMGLALVLSCVSVLLNSIIWYIMLNCSIKYDILGSSFRNVGVRRSRTTLSNRTDQRLFLQDLVNAIEERENLIRTIDGFHSCFHHLFFVQIFTSGLGICLTVYVLAFNFREILSSIYVVLLLYIIFDIFMVMYFSNEIKVASDRLSYCIFESNWIDQSNQTWKLIVILVELLKRPHQLVISKIYPLDLMLFTSILNLAYRMFNILKSFKK